jgi:hypothetical protein
LKGTINSTKEKKDDEWPIRSALMQIYYAETNLYAKQGIYSTSFEVLQQYGLSPKVYKGICTKMYFDLFYVFQSMQKTEFDY